MTDYTISLVFTKDCKKVLMWFNKHLENMDFVGGKIEAGETEMQASYRELQEETGITNSDVKLQFIRKDKTNSFILGDYSLYVTAGILNKDITLKEEKNPLRWIPVDQQDVFLNAYGYGSCYMYLTEALKVLGIKSEQNKEGNDI